MNAIIDAAISTICNHLKSREGLHDRSFYLHAAYPEMKNANVNCRILNDNDKTESLKGSHVSLFAGYLP